MVLQLLRCPFANQARLSCLKILHPQMLSVYLNQLPANCLLPIPTYCERLLYPLRLPLASSSPPNALPGALRPSSKDSSQHDWLLCYLSKLSRDVA